MSLLDNNYQDQRLTASQKKKIKPAIQGGGYNYLGKQETVTVPKKWLSDPDHVVAELAYITPREKKVLIDLNMYGSLDGKPNNAPGGLDSLQGDMGSIGGGGTSGGGGDGGDAREQYGAVGQYGGGTTTRDGGNGQPPTIEPPYVMVGGQKFAVDDPKAIEAQNVVEQESLLGNIVDLYQQYSPIGNILNIGGSILSTIGDASTSLQNKAIAFDLQNRLQKAYQDPTFDPFTPDASVTQLEQDLAKAQAGEFSQSEYEDRYGKAGDTGQLTGGGGDGERALRTALTPYAPYAITGTTPQDSMVNQYFANLGMNNQPLSSSLQTDYNNAKTNINSLLGILPPSQQFGYSEQPYGLLSSTNLEDNPFNIDYLQERGLI